MTAPSLTPDPHVLRLYMAGVLDLPVPPGLEEDGPGWDAWFEGALAAAFEYGRWTDATSIARSEIGTLDAHGRFQRLT